MRHNSYGEGRAAGGGRTLSPTRKHIVEDVGSDFERLLASKRGGGGATTTTGKKLKKKKKPAIVDGVTRMKLRR